MDEKQLLRRAYRWFGVQAPPKLTAKVRKDYGETLKELSAWVRKDKAENPENNKRQHINHQLIRRSPRMRTQWVQFIEMQTQLIL